jgi:preprotein translocase subunit YajC
MKTVIFTIAGLIFLALIYDLIRSMKSHKETKSQEQDKLKYGDSIVYWKDRVSAKRAIVLGQTKTRVTIRTSEDMRVKVVDRSDCELAEQLNTVEL